jgi:hypothetical protein
MDIPVIFIGSRKAAKHRVDPVKLRRQLRERYEGAKDVRTER